MNAIRVPQTTSQLPRYIHRAKAIRMLSYNGVGGAIMYNGDLIGFRWGENLTLEEVKQMRAKDHRLYFVYIGPVWDNSTPSDSRDNFATIIR